MASLKDSHQKAMDELNIANETSKIEEINKLMREHQKQINMFHEEHNQKNHSLKQDHQQEVSTFKQKHESEIKRLNDTLTNDT